MWGQYEQRLSGVDRSLEAVEQEFAWIHIVFTNSRSQARAKQSVIKRA